jgi:hypothetical protein
MPNWQLPIAPRQSSGVKALIANVVLHANKNFLQTYGYQSFWLGP